MNEISKAVFRAIHEGKWLQIEYQNKDEKITKFWIGILDLDVRKRTLSVDGLHILLRSRERYDMLYIDAIRSANVIEGSFQEKNEALIQDIKFNPEKYRGLFGNVANLKILNYLSECNRLDAVPYYTDYELLRLFDEDKLKEQAFVQGIYPLSQEQYGALIRQFTVNLSQKNKMRNIELGLNILSVHMPKQKGLYVLAYGDFCLISEISACAPMTILQSATSMRFWSKSRASASFSTRRTTNCWSVLSRIRK